MLIATYRCNISIDINRLLLYHIFNNIYFITSYGFPHSLLLLLQNMYIDTSLQCNMISSLYNNDNSEGVITREHA